MMHFKESKNIHIAYLNVSYCHNCNDYTIAHNFRGRRVGGSAFRLQPPNKKRERSDCVFMRIYVQNHKILIKPILKLQIPIKAANVFSTTKNNYGRELGKKRKKRGSFGRRGSCTSAADPSCEHHRTLSASITSTRALRCPRDNPHLSSPQPSEVTRWL